MLQRGFHREHEVLLVGWRTCAQRHGEQPSSLSRWDVRFLPFPRSLKVPLTLEKLYAAKQDAKYVKGLLITSSICWCSRGAYSVRQVVQYLLASMIRMYWTTDSIFLLLEIRQYYVLLLFKWLEQNGSFERWMLRAHSTVPFCRQPCMHAYAKRTSREFNPVCSRDWFKCFRFPISIGTEVIRRLQRVTG